MPIPDVEESPHRRFRSTTPSPPRHCVDVRIRHGGMQRSEIRAGIPGRRREIFRLIAIGVAVVGWMWRGMKWTLTPMLRSRNCS